MAGHHRPLTITPEIREALAAAVAYAAQCGGTVDVWMRHTPRGFKVAPAGEYDRLLKNGLRFCYRVDPVGNVTAGPSAPPLS
jgi:hypothetical protein